MEACTKHVEVHGLQQNKMINSKPFGRSQINQSVCTSGKKGKGGEKKRKKPGASSITFENFMVCTHFMLIDVSHLVLSACLFISCRYHFCEELKASRWYVRLRIY